MPTLSVVIPAKNESAAIGGVVARLRDHFPAVEVLVVDDGSTDDTGRIAAEAGARVVRHPYSKGNGAAIKSGARLATGEVIAFMDADGQHDPAHLQRLLDLKATGFDMVVGARDWSGQASAARGFANGFYNWFSSWMAGHEIADLTSGFRLVDAHKFREFLHLLPNGFSYPTSITMAFFRAGYSVGYLPIPVAKRIGKSHIRPIKDGIRFVIIIFKIGVLFSPIRVFAPFAALFLASGAANYAYTFATEGRFTNMSALMFSAGILVFLLGLIAEQITMLLYANVRE
jgi:glycosyltransferase involved in cell wall biosynthesis